MTAKSRRAVNKPKGNSVTAFNRSFTTKAQAAEISRKRGGEATKARAQKSLAEDKMGKRKKPTKLPPVVSKGLPQIEAEVEAAVAKRAPMVNMKDQDGLQRQDT